MLKLVVWDLDGTLVNSLPSTIEAFNDAIELFKKRRLPLPELMSHFGLGESEILANIVGQSDAEESYRIFLDSFQNRLADMTHFEGVLETVNHLNRKNLSQAVFTGRGRQGTDLILKHLNLEPHFKMVVTRDEVIKHKPNPEGLVKICDFLNIKPNETLMIGDSPVDIHAGRTAGVKTIGCRWNGLPFNDQLENANPDHLINHPNELLSLLENTLDTRL